MSDLQGRQRLDDIPPYLRWALVAIKEVGFPVAVAMYLIYMQMTVMPKMIVSLESNTEAMKSLTTMVNLHSKQAERAFRRILGDRYPDE